MYERHKDRRLEAVVAGVVLFGGAAAVAAYFHYAGSGEVGCGLSRTKQVTLSARNYEVTAGTPYDTAPTRFVFNGNYAGAYIKGALPHNEIVHDPILKSVAGGDELLGFRTDLNSCPAVYEWVDYSFSHQKKQSVMLPSKNTQKIAYGYIHDGKVTSTGGEVEAYAQSTNYLAPGLFVGDSQHTGGAG